MSVRVDQPTLTAEDDSSDRARSHSRQYHLRTMMMAIAVAAWWFGILRLPGAWILVAGPLAALGVGIAALLGGMVLAYLGFGLFWGLERAIKRLRRPAPHPRPVDDWWVEQ